MTTARFAEAGWREGWFLVPHEVTWRDLDAAGHVNNAVYFTFFEWARSKYWIALHGGDATHTAIDFIVARAECDFRQQLSMSDRVMIAVRIGAVRNSSFDFEYEIRKESGGTIAATGRVVVVLWDWARQQKRLIDSELKSKIARFQEGRATP